MSRNIAYETTSDTHSCWVDGSLASLSTTKQYGYNRLKCTQAKNDDGEKLTQKKTMKLVAV